MKSRNYIEYLLEYDTDDGPWSFLSTDDLEKALKNLKEMRNNHPTLKWSITEKTVTFSEILVTPKGRKVYKDSCF